MILYCLILGLQKGAGMGCMLRIMLVVDGFNLLIERI